MSGSTNMILRARTLLPVSQPPIENGAVVDFRQSHSRGRFLAGFAAARE